MNVENIGPLKSLEIPLLQSPSLLNATAGVGSTPASLAAGSAVKAMDNFQSTLVTGLRSINEAQGDAMQKVTDFLEGKGPALHTVMLSMEQANLGLEFAVQMRNKILEAYMTVMQMQV